MLLQYGTPRTELAEIFEREKPDLVFVTGLTEFDFDVPIACEAKRRGIRLIGMTRSWDNFTSHGLTRVLPDRLVLQDEFLEEMAMRYQLVDPKQIPISIVGTPHYDAYFHQRQALRSREEFFKEMQIDPKKRIILYAAMGDFLFPYENQLADVFEELARTKQVPEDVQFIYRPHPKFQTQVERIRNMQFVSVDEQTAEGTKTVQQEMEKWELDHLTHLLAYSDVVLNTASTMALEGALFDKPVISIAFNGTEKNAPYWLSAERFFDCYTHFEDAVQTGSLPLAHSPRELAEQINTALAHPEQGKEGRAALVKRFIAPYDGNSGLRLAKLLAEELRFLTVK
jgi:CDP-glycerol glycerophosphotransferase (TagB/SpsB family)